MLSVSAHYKNFQIWQIVFVLAQWYAISASKFSIQSFEVSNWNDVKSKFVKKPFYSKDQTKRKFTSISLTIR